MSELFKKYKPIISYVFFGGLTTLINIAAYFICYNILSVPNVPSTVIAWLLSVAFAFVTNKLFVFESKSWLAKQAIKEAFDFVLCRLGTGITEVFIMYAFVDRMHYNGTVMKLITNVMVIIINYIASKLFIFVKKDENNTKQDL